MIIEIIGWVATAIFVTSYLFKDPTALRRIQALAATLWVAYGVIIHATPVVVANLLVAGIAVYSSLAYPRKLAASPAKDPSRTTL
jgi:hypothetical protein